MFGRSGYTQMASPRIWSRLSRRPRPSSVPVSRRDRRQGAECFPFPWGMLAVGLNQAAQIGKPASPLRGPETARDLHLQAHHAQGLLGLVVGEGGSGVAQEAQAGLSVPAQGQGQVVAAEAALRSGPGRVSGWPPRPPPGAVAGGGFRRTYGDLFGAVDPPGVQFLLGRCRQPLRRYVQGEPFRPRCNRWLGISMRAAAWLLPPSC